MKFHNPFSRGAGTFFSTAAMLTCLSARAAVTFNLAPAAMSNTYSGFISLQISNLTAGDTVVIQKYVDANSNGVVDAGDFLWQQFKLTDGQQSLFTNGATVVTNLNAPGDADGAVNGQITAQLDLSFDFAQLVVGKYLYVLSSPAGHFTPITNAFSVTNYPFAQTISGNVIYNGSTVPNAVVILFQPGGDGENPVGGAVANNSGAYTIKVPTGTYRLGAIKSNYVMNLGTAPLVTLGAGATVTTNITVTNSTVSISGKVVDSNSPSTGLPGMLVPVMTSDNLLAVTTTDTNGNFSVGVTPNVWKVQTTGQGTSFYGYIEPGDNPQVNTSGGNVTGVTLALRKANAIFYGTVKDNLGNPLPNVDLGGDDNVPAGDGQNDLDDYTDANGRYFMPVLAGDAWEIYINGAQQRSAYTNDVFSEAFSQQNGGTTFIAGQAVLQDFTALAAPYVISGYVTNSGGGGPIMNLGVNADATIGGLPYQAHVESDENGHYSMAVASGSWSVSVNCGDGGDGLGNILGDGNFQCPDNQPVNISGGNGTANFTVTGCVGAAIYTSSLPAGEVNSFYDSTLQGSTCNGQQNWSLNDPEDFPSALTLDSDGEIFGNPDTAGTFNFSVQLDDGNGHSTNQSLSLTINPSASELQITTTSLPAAANGVFYSTTLQATGGLGAYSWGLAQGSASLPANLSLGANGVISGTPSTLATNYDFIVQVTDTNSGFAFQQLTLTVTGAAPGVSLAMVPAGSGLLEFTFPSEGGVNYALQTSQDLKHWNTVLSFTGGGGLETISAPTTGGPGATFYRVKVGP